MQLSDLNLNVEADYYTSYCFKGLGLVRFFFNAFEAAFT